MRGFYTPSATSATGYEKPLSIWREGQGSRRLRHQEHALQSHEGIALHGRIDLHPVDDFAVGQMRQRPENIGRMDAIHRRAGTDDRIEAEDLFVRHLLLQ